MIDDREPDHIKNLTFGGLPVTVTRLDHGDVLAVDDTGTMIAIERKTPSDFLNTLRDDRLFPQLTGLRSVTPWAYLMITGALERTTDGKVVVDRGATGWSWNAIQGALLTVQELGVYMTYCAGDADYEAAILRLGSRKREGQRPIVPPRQARILNHGEAALAELPGIGAEKVFSLLDYTGTVANALQYLADPDASNGHVAGIGPITVANVRKALGLQDWQILGVLPRPGVEAPPPSVVRRSNGD